MLFSVSFPQLFVFVFFSFLLLFSRFFCFPIRPSTTFLGNSLRGRPVIVTREVHDTGHTQKRRKNRGQKNEKDDKRGEKIIRKRRTGQKRKRVTVRAKEGWPARRGIDPQRVVVLSQRSTLLPKEAKTREKRRVRKRHPAEKASICKGNTERNEERRKKEEGKEAVTEGDRNCLEEENKRRKNPPKTKLHFYGAHWK